MIYFTADLHFKHDNIIKHCNRPFQSVEEMDNQLLDNWNKTVKSNDEIYILGDLTIIEFGSELSEFVKERRDFIPNRIPKHFFELDSSERFVHLLHWGW